MINKDIAGGGRTSIHPNPDVVHVVGQNQLVCLMLVVLLNLLKKLEFFSFRFRGDNLAYKVGGTEV